MKDWLLVPIPKRKKELCDLIHEIPKRFRPRDFDGEPAYNADRVRYVLAARRMYWDRPDLREPEKPKRRECEISAHEVNIWLQTLPRLA